jgi:lipooligosaccharide transport system ATP-binding protein
LCYTAAAWFQVGEVIVSSPVPLSVADLQKTYHPRHGPPLEAVRGLSFSINPGECFGLLGPNGAGKSTTMNCIVGFSPSTAGRIEIFGHEVQGSPREARSQIGVCSQEDTLDTDFTVFDQMVQYAGYFGIDETRGTERAHELLALFGLTDKADEPVEELSGGMRRRLQVARALISQPRLLILDEPTTGLDPEARRSLWAVIEAFRRDRGAILLSTHYMEEAERLCDRVAIMHKGVILDCRPPRELIQSHIATAMVRDEIRPGIFWDRPANLEDVYLRLTGHSLEAGEGGAP